MEHKVYIVNLSLRASDDVIMPFWSERVIVLTKVESSCALRSGEAQSERKKEKKRKRLSLYTQEKIQINITTLVRLSVSG